MRPDETECGPDDYAEMADLPTSHDQAAGNSHSCALASTFAIPGDPGDADAMLGELGELATATEWKRAAIVYARVWVQESPGRPRAENATSDLLTRIRLPSNKKGKISMEYTEPITQLILDEDIDGAHYQVTVAVRIAGEIGADEIATMQQFLDAIENRGQLAEFEVCRIDGDELAAWKSASEEWRTRPHRRPPAPPDTRESGQ
ncbi:MAG: hypothetical protein ACXVX7_00080 [Mycobacterium sp.]